MIKNNAVLFFATNNKESNERIYTMIQDNEKLARDFFKVGLRVAANVMLSFSDEMRKLFFFPEKPSVVSCAFILHFALMKEYNAIKDPVWPASEAYKNE